MKLNYRFPALPGLALLFFSACNEQPDSKVNIETVKQEIQAMEDAFSAGEKAKNVDAVAAYYSDDATSFNRNQPPSVGMAAIKEKISKGFAQDSVGDYNTYKVVDLFADGNHATEIGSWPRMSASGEKKENGYFMSYFEKREGKYKCVRDMSVTESPAKPGM